MRVGASTLECRPAAGGQVGVFAEHAGTWAWLDHVIRASAGHLGRPLEVLSLFAYTGGATLACAAAGARVAHVDSSQPAVAWARRNAELSGLAEAPVRWLVEDARAFVRRERRRGRHYDGVILDPPTYGHGTGAWQIDEHLEPLLEDLAALLGPRPAFALLERTHAGLRRRAPGRPRPRALRRRRRRRGAARCVPRRVPPAARRLGAQPRPLTRRRTPTSPGSRGDHPRHHQHQEPTHQRGPRPPRSARAGADGQTLVDGTREIARAIAGGARRARAVRRRGRGSRGDAPRGRWSAPGRGRAASPCRRHVIDRLAYGDRSDGLVAVVAIPDIRLGVLRLPANPLIVVLEAVEKPGNLGAVLRSADGPAPTR